MILFFHFLLIIVERLQNICFVFLDQIVQVFENSQNGKLQNQFCVHFIVFHIFGIYFHAIDGHFCWSYGDKSNEHSKIYWRSFIVKRFNQRSFIKNLITNYMWQYIMPQFKANMLQWNLYKPFKWPQQLWILWRSM